MCVPCMHTVVCIPFLCLVIIIFNYYNNFFFLLFCALFFFRLRTIPTIARDLRTPPPTPPTPTTNRSLSLYHHHPTCRRRHHRPLLRIFTEKCWYVRIIYRAVPPPSAVNVYCTASFDFFLIYIPFKTSNSPKTSKASSINNFLLHDTRRVVTVIMCSKFSAVAFSRI